VFGVAALAHGCGKRSIEWRTKLRPCAATNGPNGRFSLCGTSTYLSLQSVRDQRGRDERHVDIRATAVAERRERIGNVLVRKWRLRQYTEFKRDYCLLRSAVFGCNDCAPETVRRTKAWKRPDRIGSCELRTCTIRCGPIDYSRLFLWADSSDAVSGRQSGLGCLHGTPVRLAETPTASSRTERSASWRTWSCT
jgi:hypothetical protein